MSIKLDLGAVTAYAIAVKNGFKGTEADWLTSLKGDKGNDGQPGADGKSAYQYAVEGGYTGTREEFGQLLANAGLNLKAAETAKEGAEAAKQAAETTQQAAGNSADAAANSAADAKKTLESIPADYSALSGKVDENTSGISKLKEDLSELENLTVTDYLNIVDSNNFTEGGYDIDNTGNVVQSSQTNRRVSDFCEVNPSNIYVIYNSSSTNYYSTNFKAFNANKQFITNGVTVETVDDLKTITVYDNVRYIRFANLNNFSGIVICKKELYDGKHHAYKERKRLNSELIYANKNCYVLGDSIMAQNNVTNALAEISGLSITNYAIGGTRLSDKDGTQTNAICYRCDEMPDDLPDLILVEGGNNDCYYSDLGEVGTSKDVTTVSGAVYIIIQKLETKYPNVPIVFSTMPYRWLDKQQWKEYATIVEETCKYYGIPVLNAWTSCGFNDFNKEQYCNSDGIHVNENGGMRMAKAWLEVIKTAL